MIVTKLHKNKRWIHLYNVNYSNTNTIGTFLNGDYLASYVGDNYSNMIEDSTTWYLGTVGSGAHYRLAKYIDTAMSSLTLSTTNTKVGLLRMGELMAGQFERYTVKGGTSTTGLTTTYWTLTQYSSSHVRLGDNIGGSGIGIPSNASGVRPSINLKSNVIITGGTGLKNDPFEIELAS